MSQSLDPTSSTSTAFNRRAFVALGAGAAAAASSTGVLFAADASDFGKPHPPIVAPEDPAIVVTRPVLDRPGTAVDAYAAAPADTTPRTPGIVLVQHIWGLDATIRDDVRRYAKAGFLCIAPNLYARSRPPSGDGTNEIDRFRPAAAALDDGLVNGDLLAAHYWLRTQAASAKVGITGFCMGGGIALKQLIGSNDYAAASIFYGDVRPGTPRSAPTTANTFAYARQIATPIRGNYGARDTSIAASDVRAFFAALTPPHEVDLYAQAGHAFFDDTRASYVASAAADAWQKTLAWFERFLR